MMISNLIPGRCNHGPRSLIRRRPISGFGTTAPAVAAFATWTVDSATGVVSSKSPGTPRFQTVIGLEVHAQLDIPTKLFSGCPRPTSSFLRPNSHVWPFDAGVPGFLPRLSQEAIQAAVLSAAATKCEIQQISRFERKHYFYADLPLGYQVTQQRWPLAKDGVLLCKIKMHPRKNKTKTMDDTFSARIERIQLEQDTGKTVLVSRKDGTTDSLVDFNRAGCALIEIVFHPDLRSSTQASTAVETLRNLLRHIGTCDGKMQEGSLRCDLNISVAPLQEGDECVGDSSSLGNILDRTGNRVEVKNLNSMRHIKQAAEYEAIRQVEALTNGRPTPQETRTFDVKSGRTVVIRTKEGAKDYRFMPEPDLPPVVLDSKAFGGLDLAEFLRTSLVELPDDAYKRLEANYGIGSYLANVLTSDPPAIQMFDEAVAEAISQIGRDSAACKGIDETVANLLCNKLFGLVRDHEASKNLEEEDGGEASVKYSKVSAKQVGIVSALLAEGKVSNTMAKELIRILYTEEQGRDPRDIASERGFRLIVDAQELANICRAVIQENPEAMEKYRTGGKFAVRVTKFLIGQAMQKSKMNAHPERLIEIMAEVLDDVEPNVEK